MSKNEIMEKIKGKLIVSCQALEDEPLHSSYIMGRMAYAAYEGGAAGIRANSVQDIKEIKISVNLPIIGIIKKIYENNKVFISPTVEEIDKLVKCGVDIIATDGTKRIRPGNITLDDFFKEVRKKYPNQLFMADCSTYEEGIHAAEIGFDFIGTTLSGYTEYTKGWEFKWGETKKLEEYDRKTCKGSGQTSYRRGRDMESQSAKASFGFGSLFCCSRNCHYKAKGNYKKICRGNYVG